MSIIPNDILKPVDSENMKTFSIEDSVVTSPYLVDFANERLAFWKSAIIRNLQTSFNLTYRTKHGNDFKPLPPLSERKIKGWGSLLEIVTSDPAPNIEIDYIGVKREEALL